MGSDRADLPWLLGGCALALVLSAAAARMMIQGTDLPRVDGADHLKIFAQPSQWHEERVRAAQMPARQTLDFSPTATMPTRVAPVDTQPMPRAPAVDLTLPGAGYTLVSAARGRATFVGPSGMLVVKPGETVPGLGRVAEIARRDGGWTVVLSGGAER